MKEESILGNAPALILPAKVGPFNFDHDNHEMTLDPGIYVLIHPLKVGILPETELVGIRFNGAVPADPLDTAGRRV